MANFILANGVIAKSSSGRHEVFILWGEVMCMAKGKGFVFMKITLAERVKEKEGDLNPVFWICFPYRSIFHFSLKKECLTVPSQ